jgi:hypothetical protein
LTICVSAFHESVMTDKLKGLFSPPTDRLFDETLRTQCVKCQATFALFIHDRVNARNASYVTKLNALITEDCNEGKHSEELSVSD